MRQEAIDVLRSAVSAGGELQRHGAAWVIVGSNDPVAASMVGALFRAGCLTGKRRSGRAEVSPMGRRTAGAAGAVPAIGAVVTFRDTGDRPRLSGIARSSRYLEGRVIAVPGAHRLLCVARAADGRLGVWEPQRAHASARWKAMGPTPLGAWAPGRHRHAPALWARLAAFPGLLPAAWSAAPEGEPYTVARLRWQAVRLASMGAEPVTLEERVARVVFPSHFYGVAFQLDPNEPPALAGLRRALRVHASASWGMDVAPYLAAFIDANEESIRAADVKELTRLVEHVAWWGIVRPRLDAEYAAVLAAPWRSEQRPPRLEVPDATLAEVTAALEAEIARGEVDASLLPEAFAANQARIDARRAELGLTSKPRPIA